jgi:LysM repeat protein
VNQKPYIRLSALRKGSFIVAEIIPAFFILIIPFSVHAGMFTHFMNLFTEEVVAGVAQDSVDHSALNTPLLSSKASPEAVKATGGADIFYDEDGVMVSTGPIGEDEISESGISNGEISVYVVREGDSLSEIADMYGVTVNTIMWANSLSKATGIQKGDSLVILPIVGVRHSVAKGETLGSIVKKYGADLDEVLEYNNLTTVDDLAVGDELMIPGGELHTATKVAGAKPTKTSGVATGGAGFSHPLPGSIRTQGIHGYNGVDLAAPAGTPVLAAAGGTVIVAKASGWNGGYGNYVVIKHKNTQTLYAHLSSVSVGVGETVSVGQGVGIIGNTGKSTGTHLHFEVRGGTNPF